MNKLEKILAQSVTSEMVAEHLTEKEIEEKIKEIEEEKNSVDEYIQFKKEEIEEHEEYIRNNEKLIARSKEEKKRAITRFAQLIRAEEEFRIALRKTKARNGTFRKGYVSLKEIVNPNYRRVEFVEWAKKYIKRQVRELNKEGKGVELTISVDEAAKIEITDGRECFIKTDSLEVNNTHINVALALATALNDEVAKHFKCAPQPTELVEGMIVEFRTLTGTRLKRGRIKSINKDEQIALLEDFEVFGGGIETNIVNLRDVHPKIIDDTKAKYKEEEK